MQQQDQIEALLRKAAPLCNEIAREAQQVAAAIMNSDEFKKHLTRTASANQAGGVAQWRLVGDMLVKRQGELPCELQLATSDAEQNRGLYYFKSTKPAIVLTVRREPHKQEDEPKALQLQWEAIIDEVDVDFGGRVPTVYLHVPPLGKEPTFEVTARGESLLFGFNDLLAGEHGLGSNQGSVLHLPTAPAMGAIVRSAGDKNQELEQEDVGF